MLKYTLNTKNIFLSSVLSGIKTLITFRITHYTPPVLRISSIYWKIPSNPISITLISVDSWLALWRKCLITGSNLIFWRLPWQPMVLSDRIYLSKTIPLLMFCFIMSWANSSKVGKVSGDMWRVEMGDSLRFWHSPPLKEARLSNLTAKSTKSSMTALLQKESSLPTDK